jgi:hypothetical protein
LKLVQERAGNKLEAILPQQNASGSANKSRIGKWDYMKLKSFCTTKEMVSKLKRLPTE